MEAPADDVMTTKEAAAYLKVPVRTLMAWRKRGVAPPGALVGGRQWRYRKAALDQWLTERETTGPAGGSNRHETGLRADDDASSGQTAS